MGSVAHRNPGSGIWLGVGIMVLVLLVGLLLLSLRDGEPPALVDRPPALVAPTSTPAVRGAASGPRPRPARPRPAPPRTTPGPDSGPALTRVAPDAGPAPREPLGVHTAPAALPATILQEKDPVRREQLMRMHREAVALSRASRLRRRARMLQDTLTRARQEKNWSGAQIQRVERDLDQLRQAIVEAEQAVKQTRAATAAGTP